MFKASKTAERITVLSAVLFLASCGSSSKKYIQKGNDADAGGHFEEATLNYRKAIQKDAASSEAYYRLGLTELKRGRVGQSLEALQRAADLAPDNPEPKAQVAELLLAAYLGSPVHNIEFAERLSKIADQLVTQNPRSEKGFKLKGSLDLIDGKPAEAVNDLEKAAALAPSSPEVAQLLSSALIRSGKANEGIALARQTIDQHKDYSPIYDFLIQYYAGSRQPDEAEKIERLRIANNPKNPQFVVQLAVFFARMGKRSEMEAELQSLLNSAEYPTGRLDAGAFYRASGQPDEALRIYQDGIHADQAHRLDYQKRIALIYYTQGRRDEALQELADTLRDRPQDPEAQTLKATILVEGGKPEEIDAGLKQLTALSAQQPDDTSIRYQLGQAYAAQGDLKNAREQFDRATSNQGTYITANLALARLDEGARKWQSMLRHSNYALLMEPANPGAMLVNATAMTNTGDYDKAEAELAALLKQQPDFKPARLALARLDLARGRTEKAEAAFGSELKSTPNDLQALSGLVDTYIVEKKSDLALHLASARLSENPGSPALTGILADAAMQSGDYDLAIGKYEELSKSNPSSAGLHFRIGQAYYEKGDDQNAAASFQKALSLDAHNIAAAGMLATTTGRKEDRDKVITLCRAALKDDPADAETENNLAFLLAEDGANLDEALALARRAVESEPSDTGYADTLGYVLARKGVPDESINVLQKLVSNHPGVASFHYHLALALVSKGDRPKSLNELRTALEKSPSRSEKHDIQRLLAQVS